MIKFRDFINEKVSRADLKNAEDMLDRLFKQAGIDIEFTKHFLDRINDPRNGKEITIDELITTYQKVFNKHKVALNNLMPDYEALIKDFNNNINIPFVVNINTKTGYLEIIAKTIMRKKNFKSSNRAFGV